MNKKAQFESRLLAVILIFVIGIILIFFNLLNNEIYDSLDEYFNKTTSINTSEAQAAISKIQDVENSAWDYGFLAMFMGIAIQIIMFSFATRVNIAFYWLLVLIDIPVLIVGVVLSNIWQEVASDPQFATTIARFPITDAILGTYYPIAIMFILFISSVFLFGKKPSQ